MPWFTVESWWSDQTQQGVPEGKARAYLVSRPVDPEGMEWSKRAFLWTTDASHAGWVMDQGDAGADLIQSGPKGDINLASIRHFDSADLAMQAFSYSNSGNEMPVFIHGDWLVDASDYGALVNDWNRGQVPYNFASTNSNAFASWFGAEAGVPIPETPAASHLFKSWLPGWNTPVENFVPSLPLSNSPPISGLWPYGQDYASANSF